MPTEQKYALSFRTRRGHEFVPSGTMTLEKFNDSIVASLDKSERFAIHQNDGTIAVVPAHQLDHILLMPVREDKE